MTQALVVIVIAIVIATAILAIATVIVPITTDGLRPAKTFVLAGLFLLNLFRRNIIKDMIVFKYDVTKEKEIFNFPYFQRNSQYLNVMLQEELDQVVIAENDKFITDRISFIKKQWEKVESTFLKSLGDFYETELVMPDITCYLIRLNIFPYGYGKNQQEEWFAAPLADTTMRVLGVAMHELTHYFQPHKLPRSVKEAIPVILDDAEKFKIVNYDKGHKDDSKEMEWRKIIFNLYKDGGKFSDLEALVQERKDEFEGQNWEGRTA